jgi:glycosyltransferase involved in cell wall biosynthesis
VDNNNLSFLNKNLVIKKKQQEKKKVLIWSDSVIATTGFGTVSKHIVAALYGTGKYEIDQLAINHPAKFHDAEIPISILPAKLYNPKDPYGNKMFVDLLLKKEYDIVLIINDTFVVEEVAGRMAEIRDIKSKKKHKQFNLVYYYPIDCRLLEEASTMAKIADRSVAYTRFAEEKSKEVNITPTDIIYHGTDVDNFFPVSAEIRRDFRKEFLGITSDDTFVVVNVNRNSRRKDIARTILAFHEFRKQVPNSKLYLHTKVLDSSGGVQVDLGIPVKELGLSMANDVIFPRNYSVSNGYPIEVLNRIYNAGDMYLSTHLGEGWGLTVTEAMAAGVSVVVPRNTSMPEIIGDNERGYLYPCKEKVYVDNKGKDKQMLALRKARTFTEKFSWKEIGREWVKLFDELKDKGYQIVQSEGEML